MAASSSAQHAQDVAKGERFAFGKNWRAFLSHLNEERIRLAEQSLTKFLGTPDLSGQRFLDIGSGSGLFSLAARRLGAMVYSFDYDPNSVACTAELRRRYFPNDADWAVEQGSALDREYLRSLGVFDVVYSWGVLHHTGSMWDALENVKESVKIGGRLFIAIYNELGAVTDEWLEVKKKYNRLPRVFQLPYAVGVITKHEYPVFRTFKGNGGLLSYVRTWSEYSRNSTRGMSRWHDWIDWIGGLPYECASIEAIVDFYGKDGFRLQKLESRAISIGCNEFVFVRKAAIGVHIENPLPQSRFLLRQSGQSIVGPFYATDIGYVAETPVAVQGAPDGQLILFRDGNLVGQATAVNDRPTFIVVASSDWLQNQVDISRFEAVVGRLLKLDQVITPQSGHMYRVHLPDLSGLADNAPGRENSSPIFLFEDERQLALPHSLHRDIVDHGMGRFSHWGEELLFASSDNTDPRTNGRKYSIVIAER